jgi:3-hydroxy-9,10-secoandrosta-1,3,5(10)-triene-9,17-dione monooxygenase reductase component
VAIRAGAGGSGRSHLGPGCRMIEPSEFRRVMGHFPTGVTIVTARTPGEEPCGLTVNAFCSVSLEPPLVLVCIEKTADSHHCIGRMGFFGVSILDAKHGESLSRRFAETGMGDKFRGIAYRVGAANVPLLEQAVAWMECRVREAVDAGDHTIFIGEVLAGGARDARPLVYFRGGYGRFVP